VGDKPKTVWYPRRAEKKVVILPASMTFDPGLMFSQEVTNAISARYKICVRCGRAMVQSSGVGRKTWMNPRPWLEATFEP
jgi:ferredoxin-like protein FixX